jgi:hypothetical protein
MVFHEDDKDTIIRAGEVKEYCNEYFFSCIEKWALTKMWGLAHGSRGWADEPIEYIQAISILDNEQNLIEHEEIEKRNEEIKNKSKH